MGIYNGITSVFIFGKRGRGKTTRSLTLLKQIEKEEGKQPFIFGQDIEGFNSIYSEDALNSLINSVVFFDEINLYIKDQNKLIDMLQLARHNNITFIMTTANQRFISRDLSQFIDIYEFLSVNLKLFKQGSYEREILKQFKHMEYKPTELYLNVPMGRTVQYNTNEEIFKIYTFEDILNKEVQNENQ